MTGWLPSEIGNLTLKQINLLTKGWSVRSSDKVESSEQLPKLGDSDNPKSFAETNPTIEDLRMFNLTAGIERVARKPKQQ